MANTLKATAPSSQRERVWTIRERIGATVCRQIVEKVWRAIHVFSTLPAQTATQAGPQPPPSAEPLFNRSPLCNPCPRSTL